MAKFRRHVSVNLIGLIENYKGRKITFFEDDAGNKLSDKQAREEIQKHLDLGHKMLPIGECEGFDPFGGGCPGHKIED
ncbi:hypothetical protein [Sphingobacterium thalpophilum]|uniref:hypothetical protein n=1 Tax=Sphingobacterium thalpophilum TaxID=259 RepID=UPI0024A73F01|nr:hypothetical protein [Sphingobacterium thalpophilum]